MAPSHRTSTGLSDQPVGVPSGVTLGRIVARARAVPRPTPGAVPEIATRYQLACGGDQRYQLVGPREQRRRDAQRRNRRVNTGPDCPGTGGQSWSVSSIPRRPVRSLPILSSFRHASFSPSRGSAPPRRRRSVRRSVDARVGPYAPATRGVEGGRDPAQRPAGAAQLGHQFNGSLLVGSAITRPRRAGSHRPLPG